MRRRILKSEPKNSKKRDKINPNHESERGALQSLGVFILLISFLMIVIGFSVVEETVAQFIMIGIGGVGIFGAIRLLNISFMGKYARYVAGETAPVVKDSLEYILDSEEIKPRKNSERRVEERLSKLKLLRQKNIITQQEYTIQRQRILEESL